MRRSGRKRRWAWRRTWNFRSNSTSLPPWDVNCPFPFPSDQGGHDKTNCRPVILSTQGPVSQKTALTFGWVFSHKNRRALTKHNSDRSSGKRSRVLLDSAAAIFSGLLPEGRSLRLEAVRCGVVYCCPSLSFDWPTIRQSLTVDTGGAGSAESRRRAVRPAGRRCLMTVSPRQRTPNGVGWPSYKTHHDLINQNRFFCHILIIKETRGRH